MILFFQGTDHNIYATGCSNSPGEKDITKLKWLFGNAQYLKDTHINGPFIGPRKEMVTPWSTNAVEITQNMGIKGISRIEKFLPKDSVSKFDLMLQSVYNDLDQELFTIEHEADPILFIEDIKSYNAHEGLALSEEEIDYLESVSRELGRKLTDSEVFGFSQVNSEHCRHKIFNGKFILNGEEQPFSLFQLIRKTSERNPNKLVSAYSDNVAFIEGPDVIQFAPKSQDQPDYFDVRKIKTVLSLKAETHNFPTTVEPFNGAATGSGGEIRDRMAGGTASIPLAGTAVYMTSYSRLEGGRTWESKFQPRKWLYQSPVDILIKASNGASDFGNKFGQPLICGSLLTFEHEEGPRLYGYDKVIMLAGGIGYANAEHSIKKKAATDDTIVVMGGDNYRIGMGGGAVSSVATGEYKNTIELNAIQRSNPEMQKRVYNAIRAMAESDKNPIISIHDHGAGGHLNCLSELVEDKGGTIEIGKLPVGDPTLSEKEVIGNESQERMGLLIREKDLNTIRKVSERERAPLYQVGKVTGDNRLTFKSAGNGPDPINWDLKYLFGSSPVTILEDDTTPPGFNDLHYDVTKFKDYLEQVLQLEAVACKDWLTNKVDRSVTGKVAVQQTAGSVQLPLNNVGVMTVDYHSLKGVATSIGHAPAASLIDPASGSRLSVAEALTNLIWAPVESGLVGVSLSANWMWPARNQGENYRLYHAVEGISDFVEDLGINIPTGKDSLSMTQKYPDGRTVYSPGTVIVSTVAEVTDIRKVVTPVLDENENSRLLYIDLSCDDFKLGGSSLAQAIGNVGSTSPDVRDPAYFKKTFNAIQELIHEGLILAGHDISAGGLITALLEMTFPSNTIGLEIDTSILSDHDVISVLFSEQPGLVIQVSDADKIIKDFESFGIKALPIGRPLKSRKFIIKHHKNNYNLNIDLLRDTWFRTSYLLDIQQTKADLAKSRFVHYKDQELKFNFPVGFSGRLEDLGINKHRDQRTGVRAAIIREKGVNGDREMAYSMYFAGFDVKDVHMTDLISGREDLSDVNFIVFVGGFSNSDVLGSAKGWAGAFLYNPKAKEALDSFYRREDTLSLGVCNGCQLMMELDLIYPDHEDHPRMAPNESGKFESSFLNITVQENNSVMFRKLSGSRLGLWVAHGEGKFEFAGSESDYAICAKFSYEHYPGNPNGSMYNAAAICSKDGRHLAMMPHMERAILPWQWPYYLSGVNHEITPWLLPFIFARRWIESKT